MKNGTAQLLKVARPLRRWSSRLVVTLYGRGLGRIVGGWLLLLTTIGRRSGRQYTTPIGYVAADAPGASIQPGTVVYLFRAAPGGADWLANLRAQPAVKVRIGPHRYQARASVLRGERQRRQAPRRLPAWADRAGAGGPAGPSVWTAPAPTRASPKPRGPPSPSSSRCDSTAHAGERRLKSLTGARTSASGCRPRPR